MVSSWRATVIVLTGLSGLALISGCGGLQAGETSQVGSHPEDEAALVDALVNRQAIVSSSAGYWPTLSELFPADNSSAILRDAFRAEVVDVDPGVAFAGTLDGEPGQIELPTFDDESAQWRSFHVNVRVSEVFAGPMETGQLVTLGIAFGSNLEQSVVENGFTSMGEVVAFTANGDFVVPYDESLVPVLYDAAFLSPVDQGAVPFPALQEAGAGQDELAAQMDTLEELRAVSSEATETPS